jgi:hypothetical protein
MEMRDLTPFGYEGYFIRKDMILVGKNDRLIYGNQNGQVSLPGPNGKRVWRSILKLYELAFTDPQNASDLESVYLTDLGYPNYIAREDGYIFLEEFDGCLQRLNLHNGSVKLTDLNGVVTWKQAHIIIAQVFIPNPARRKYVSFRSRNRKDLHVSNLLWSAHRSGHGSEDVMLDLYVRNPDLTLEQIADRTDKHVDYVKAVLSRFISNE